MTPDANYQAEAQNKFEILLEKNYPGFWLIGESTIPQTDPKFRLEYPSHVGYSFYIHIHILFLKKSNFKNSFKFRLEYPSHAGYSFYIHIHIFFKKKSNFKNSFKFAILFSRSRHTTARSLPRAVPAAQIWPNPVVGSFIMTFSAVWTSLGSSTAHTEGWNEQPVRGKISLEYPSCDGYYQ